MLFKDKLFILGSFFGIVFLSFLITYYCDWQVLSAISSFFRPEKLSARDWNFVLINIDSLRADHISSYGYSQETTPFLDSLFKEGVIFKNAITPAYLTFQTDAAIFSGLYPSQNNVQVWNTPINDKLFLLPKILELYGYKTAAFVSPSLWERFGISKQFNEYTITRRKNNIAETKIQVADWIKNQGDKKFFLFWHIYDVHLPYRAMETEYRGQFSDLTLGWCWEAQSTSSIPQMINLGWERELKWNPLSEEDVKYLQAAYDEGIKYTDNQLKDFFDQLKQSPNYQNTVFIISSEHGEDLKEHGFIFHRDIYEVNTHVPLVIIAPGLKSKIIDEVVSLLDIMPTILELADIPVPENIEGKTLIPLINGLPYTNRPIYIERPPFDEYAVRLGDWKYILRNPNKAELLKILNADLSAQFFNNILKNDFVFNDELYDLKKDPPERNNLIGQGLEIEKILKELALKFRAKMTEIRSASQIDNVDLNILTYP